MSGCVFIDCIRNIFKIVEYSSPRTPAREKEEACYMMFLDVLEESEGA